MKIQNKKVKNFQISANVSLGPHWRSVLLGEWSWVCGFHPWVAQAAFCLSVTMCCSCLQKWPWILSSLSSILGQYDPGSPLSPRRYSWLLHPSHLDDHWPTVVPDVMQADLTLTWHWVFPSLAAPETRVCHVNEPSLAYWRMTAT